MESTDQGELLTREEVVFYDEVRGLVVVFLFFVILFTVAHLTLQYFVSKSDSDMKQERADRAVHQLVLGVCTFALTISLTGYSLLPFSIAANQVLLSFPHSYYVQWLNTDLVKDLALVVNVGTKISCVTLPFSYFLLISLGFRRPFNVFGSRLIEAFCLLLFTYILIFGTVWSLASFLVAVQALVTGYSDLFPNSSFLSTDPIAGFMHSTQTLSWPDIFLKYIPETLLRMLEAVQLVVSLTGLLLLLACTPVGLLNLGFYLLTSCIRAFPDLISRTVLQDRLAQLHFDALCIEDDMETVSLLSEGEPLWYESLTLLTHRSSSGPASLREKVLVNFTTRLPLLHVEMVRLKHRLSKELSTILREWLRPLVPGLVLGLIICMVYLMQSYVVLNIFNLIRNLLFGGGDVPVISNTLDNIAHKTQDERRGAGFALGRKPVSMFGHFGAALQICLIQFLLLLGLWGFYATPTARFLRPKAHSMCLEVIMGNVILLLLFSSALPLQSNLLGLTPLTLPSSLKIKYSSPSPPATPPDREISILKPARNSPVPQTKQQNSNCHIFCFLSSEQTDESAGITQHWSFWETFFPFSFHPAADDVPVSSSSLATTTESKTVTEPDNVSILSWIVYRTFTFSAPSSASCGLIIVILVYNLCFLITSVWIAGRRLREATLSFSLEIAASLRCLQHVQQLSSNHGRNAVDTDKPLMMIDGVSCEMTVGESERLFAMDR